MAWNSSSGGFHSSAYHFGESSVIHFGNCIRCALKFTSKSWPLAQIFRELAAGRARIGLVPPDDLGSTEDIGPGLVDCSTRQVVHSKSHSRHRSNWLLSWPVMTYSYHTFLHNQHSNRNFEPVLPPTCTQHASSSWRPHLVLSSPCRSSYRLASESCPGYTGALVPSDERT